ncbi:MAG: hypothetical protein EXR61_00890 [Chloroflexi bacterium]|nr:hypothetical protein [Chloroflexota bacterium]
MLTQFAAERERVGAELREITALVESTRGEVARLRAREEQALAEITALRDLADATGSAAFAVSDELVAVLRRGGAMVAELETLQAKAKLLDRLNAQVVSFARRLGLVDGAAVPRPVGAPPAAAGDETLLRAVLQTQEEERRRIARAVHDGPAQAMANVVLQSEISERLFAIDAGRARTELAALRAMVGRTLQELRGFIFELRPMILDDLGLVPTLRRYIQTLVDKHGVKVDFSSVGRDRRLPTDDEVAVFRLVQDALLERVQKAVAKELAVALDWRDLTVEIRLQSDGKALATSGELASWLPPNERVGLLRAEAVQEERTDGQTILNVRVPIVAASRMIT